MCFKSGNQLKLCGFLFLIIRNISLFKLTPRDRQTNWQWTRWTDRWFEWLIVTTKPNKYANSHTAISTIWTLPVPEVYTVYIYESHYTDGQYMWFIENGDNLNRYLTAMVKKGLLDSWSLKCIFMLAVSSVSSPGLNFTQYSKSPSYVERW